MINHDAIVARFRAVVTVRKKTARSQCAEQSARAIFAAGLPTHKQYRQPTVVTPNWAFRK
jgi:hypothetical protein